VIHPVLLFPFQPFFFISVIIAGLACDEDLGTEEAGIVFVARLPTDVASSFLRLLIFRK
jgi:hypothetical protein